MKEVKSRSYLVIGCAYAGMEKNILDVLSGVRKFYNAQVIHLGQLTSLEERKVWNNRLEKIITLESIQDELHEEEDGKSTWKRRYRDKYQQHKEEAELVEKAQDHRIRLLQDAFGKENVSFLYNEQQVVDSEGLSDIDFKGEDLKIGKHLLLTCLSANGEKVSHNPISPRSFRYFRGKDKSVILPHPTPALKSFNKQGLNQAHVMITTGSLNDVSDPHRVSEFYKCTNLPSAVLVVENEKDGTFFTKRIHFDYARDPVSKRDKPFALDDGLRFDIRGEWHELKSSDKGLHSTDDHAPWQHPGVLASLRALGTLHEPSVFVNGGDSADMASVSHHNTGKPLVQENLRLLKDLEGMQDLLNAQTETMKHLKHKILVDSNHANWLTQFVERNPMLVGLLDWETVAKQWLPGWEVYYGIKGENKVFYFGDLAIRHGHQERGGITKGHEIFIKYLCGHWHAHNEFLRASAAGAGCMLGPAYVENNITAWTNTLTTLQKWKDKSHQQIRTILHNDEKETSSFCYRNKIYVVPWYKIS